MGDSSSILIIKSGARSSESRLSTLHQDIPKANRKVEATNKTLLNILKMKLGGQKREWAEELLSTLWAYRTSVRTPTGETPFSLVYGTEAMILVEVAIPTNRNDERLRENLDFLEERREEAVSRAAANKWRVEKYFNKRVQPRNFKVGDMVLKQTGVTTQDEGNQKTWFVPT
ncbi:uncharacterized protein LOC121245210 [Juglans microcarpa x Juglans regia]|uniref:uncharacterized protein LOC121245210 n=1 Tax=Juglans microcarpa x Juglans regia TaxID=2249226 RepID=UPI001B7EF203|nr:uncharacterized protein LOC121245210 [Juglans microcarpa x Juglans regia]